MAADTGQAERGIRVTRVDVESEGELRRSNHAESVTWGQRAVDSYAEIGGTRRPRSLLCPRKGGPGHPL